MGTIKNPILPGFHPDPAILRVGDDYFVATSTFEWFPGVLIYHSKDLIHWRVVTHALNRRSQLSMVGNPDSGGVWAPCLTWHEGLFYLCYTDMKIWRDPFCYKDGHNYLVTAPDITGPWSEPIYLNSSGFDPSLFHDDDGRKWLVNLLWDFRAEETEGYFGGILLQEYEPQTQRLTGPIKNIFKGSPLGLTEGPHLYKHEGHYYLMTAEGGTSYEHAVTMARSTRLEGPYEIDPENPILTSAGSPENDLQKAGHASLVETQSSEWYLAHLCGRPVGENRRCILGRETALQKCYWSEDGWLRVEGGDSEPKLSVPAPELPEVRFEKPMARNDFDSSVLCPTFQTLRTPVEESWLSLKDRPGWLRLYGRESLGSRHHQSLLARRVQAVHCEASTCLDFDPKSFQEMAGLVAFYDVTTHYYLYLSHDEVLGRSLNLLAADVNQLSMPMPQPVKVQSQCILLKVTFAESNLQFWYAEDGEDWKKIGPELDATKLSDDYAYLSFTGAFVGICAQDLSGHRRHADFDWFEYVENGAA
ncbi:glycoside hydrolase family 43 protein [bacterium]|nr:glycoside hydrolase family 43 protein [bacterium]